MTHKQGTDTGRAGRGGLSRTALYRAARNGRYQRIARGIYLPADTEAADWDWIEAATRCADATICPGYVRRFCYSPVPPRSG